MITVQQLAKRFGAQTAVDALSFEVPAGQIVGFLGPNGAGKSTTLKMLTGMLEPSAGTATVCGFDLRRDILEVKRHVGFVPESGAVFESLTGLEYLEMVAALYAIPEEATRARIRQFIAFFDLSADRQAAWRLFQGHAAQSGHHSGAAAQSAGRSKRSSVARLAASSARRTSASSRRWFCS
jgi:ABC-type multidrug transport system ATPase subunit